MNLYIMRHGIAYDSSEWKGSEFDRPLTPEGFEKTRTLIEKLHSSKALQVDAIWSSPLVRARQTAEIAGDVLGLKVKLVEILQCGADLSDLVNYAKKDVPPKRLLSVGHEPDCGMILGELIGDVNLDLAFKRAGMAQVEGELKPGGMKLMWKYSPKEILGESYISGF